MGFLCTITSVFSCVKWAYHCKQQTNKSLTFKAICQVCDIYPPALVLWLCLRAIVSIDFLVGCVHPGVPQVDTLCVLMRGSAGYGGSCWGQLLSIKPPCYNSGPRDATPLPPPSVCHGTMVVKRISQQHIWFLLITAGSGRGMTPVAYSGGGFLFFPPDTFGAAAAVVETGDVRTGGECVSSERG